jgi:hypothetical protein
MCDYCFDEYMEAEDYYDPSSMSGPHLACQGPMGAQNSNPHLLINFKRKRMEECFNRCNNYLNANRII